MHGIVLYLKRFVTPHTGTAWAIILREPHSKSGVYKSEFVQLKRIMVLISSQVLPNYSTILFLTYGVTFSPVVDLSTSAVLHTL